jgi:putative membrane-bound dehydrogenase-like protein
MMDFLISRDRKLRSLGMVSAILSTGLAWCGSIVHAADIRIDHRTFTLPDGFTIEKVAGPSLVDRPITASFDEQGRLYVADSSGSNEKVEIQLEKKPHRIVRLEDTDGDGRFDKSIVFADRLMFPEGTLWHRGSLYVSAPPSIWKLTDTDGDGVADQREEWFQGKTLTGCANDLHGPYLGRDGRIYWAKGAFAEQTHQIRGKSWKTSAAHFFRSTVDGKELEPVMTGGMDNPVDMAFTPGGERIFTTTFLTQPSLGQRDGLIHAIYGGIYGKTNGKTQEPQHVWTGPDLMPVLAHLGPSASSGLTDYESDTFGPGYRGNLFSSSFNLRKIFRHELGSQDQAALSSRDSDFVVCDDTDFHPTDVLTDADGSLIVVDTGGWYKLCCPTSHIAKEDVLGVIYRVRRTEATPVADPRGLGLKWDAVDSLALIERLGDARFAVRERAIELLAQRGADAVEPLKKAIESNSASVELRRNAVWTACRIGTGAALTAVRSGLSDPDASVRQAAAHAAGLHRDQDAGDRLIAMLSDESQPASVRRAAAEALGRVGKTAAVGPILAVVPNFMTNRVMRHSLTYALVEIDSADAIFEILEDLKDVRARIVGLVVLDQMGVPNLPVSELIAAMDSSDETVRTLASWIVSRHPEWADRLVADFKAKLLEPPSESARLDAFVARLSKFAASSADVRELLGNSLEHGHGQTRSIALKAMAATDLKTCPDQWEIALQKTLMANDPIAVEKAIEAFRKMAPAKGETTEVRFRLLVKRSEENDLAPDLQWAMLSVIPPGSGPVSAKLFSRVVDRLSADMPAMTRLSAVDLLSKLRLTSDQRQAIATKIGALGPMESQKLVAMFENGTDEKAVSILIAGLRSSTSLAALSEESLRNVVAKAPEKAKAEMEQILAVRNRALIDQRHQVDSMLSVFPSGDIRRGQAVFNSAKAACRTCHSVGYVGGKVGPDLSKIGAIRTERDLLEAIVYPSLSFVRSYEPVTIALSDGRVLNGIVQSEDADILNLVANATETVRVPKAEIDDISPSTVSVMPAGLDQQLSRQELADLITYLRSSK